MPDRTDRDDPHAPVTNVVRTQDSTVQTRLAVPPVLGSARPVDPTDAGAEAVGDSGLRLEAAVETTAPDVHLPDIGAASFGGADVQLETVHGSDDRRQVQETARYPWSATASLLITTRDGAQWIGTGWFVSPRTLVTAGHCVYITGSGVPGRDGWVLSMQVLPGRNGTSLPFGAVTASQFWTVRGWVDGGDENYDYGAIVLPSPLGETVGTYGFAVLPDDELAGRVLNVAGYPGDQPPGTLWYGSRTVAALGPSKVHYDIDTAGGQSGAAVYVIEDGKRLGVAVHAYGGPTTNSGTRISPEVFRNLSDWQV
ncbi:MAG: Glutamyl endopeptidase precursor, blaSE [uncultured Frankineae bacterium]|uniref:Serine protease n=1 Tax=uncultured Frankineae bacterium TaxID=437475 RepID=A0A6J4KE58_9ACTN|nr:MAG: Glutamyl endopeptidase precursor, blaSE [uncultured Frankineae bacterium]